MSKEKQIDEMAKDVASTPIGTVKPDLTLTELGEVYENTFIMRIAKHLYNAGYRKQSEWISVEERLPQTDEKYLVYTSGGRIYTSYYYITNTYGFELRDVTHWMPLPEAPKKGGAE